MKNNVVIAKRECLGCGEEFDSRTFVVFGVRVNFDRGYCPACRDKKMAELVEKEETERLAGIAKKRRDWPLRVRGSQGLIRSALNMLTASHY